MMMDADYFPVLIVAIIALIALVPIAIESAQPQKAQVGKAVQLTTKVCRTETKRCGLENSLEECQEFDDKACCKRYIIAKYCDPKEPYCIQDGNNAYCSETQVKEETNETTERDKQDWVCDKWGSCINFKQERNCVKGNEAALEKHKPATEKSCTPPASCDDGIRNQGEIKVDCGGSCDPCPPEATCYDNIQNQGERDVDCGGPCQACVSCYDGIQNQGEREVDCGGPCQACPDPEQPIVKQSGPPLVWWIILGLIGVILIGGGIGFVIYEKKQAEEKLNQEKKSPNQASIEKLTEYVLREHASGKRPETIFIKLHREGWPLPILKKVLVKAKKEIIKHKTKK